MFVKCSESRAKAAHFLFDLRYLLNILFRDDVDGLIPLDAMSHEAYNKKKSGSPCACLALPLPLNRRSAARGRLSAQRGAIRPTNPGALALPAAPIRHTSRPSLSPPTPTTPTPRLPRPRRSAELTRRPPPPPETPPAMPRPFPCAPPAPAPASPHRSGARAHASCASARPCSRPPCPGRSPVRRESR